jgi:hypothetical protein
VSVTLDGFEQAMAENPAARGTRPYVIHAELIAPADFERAARLDVGFNMQPAIMPMIADTLPGQLGLARTLHDWPFATTIKAGVLLAASSDLPVTYPNWREGVQAMVLREAAGSGKVSGPDERVSIEDAIRAYTINGAWQDHMDDIKGSIEVGKLADFCVLDADILTVEPHEIKGIGVTMTIVGGKTVYDAASGGFAPS